MARWISPRLRRHWFVASLVALAVIVLGGLGAIVVYAGIYDIAADTPHTKAVYWLLEEVRERSIAVRARDIVVPTDLKDKKRIAAGAAEYSEMCSQCHLAPGMEKTEISQGLYPRAPELFRGDPLTAAEQFWVVKHGIKATGMPAWGPTHDDVLLWDIVAFVRTLPTLNSEQYEAVVKSAPEDHEQMMHDMPGMHGEDNGHHD
jgi:mono/diheme cytochrome c family protein